MITALADGRLLAEQTGTSPAEVVALHGWGRSGHDFDGILTGLNAVAIHLPGFGITDEPDEVWNSERYADEVAAALTDGPPVVIVGHSFGGRVAVRLAAKYPQLVSGLVLTGVPLVRLTAAPRPSLGYRLVRMLSRVGLISAARLEAEKNRRGSDDYRAASGVMRDIMVTVVGENYDDDLRAITCPVRMVWGELDPAAPADAGLAASEMIPGAQFRLVCGEAHLMEGELRAAVREELHELIEELAG